MTDEKTDSHFIYRCRHCGETFSDGCVGLVDHHDKIMISILLDLPMPHGIIGAKPGLTTLHHCNDKMTGLADLIGSEKRPR